MNKIMVLLAKRIGKMDVGPHTKHTDLSKLGFYC